MMTHDLKIHIVSGCAHGIGYALLQKLDQAGNIIIGVDFDELVYDRMASLKTATGYGIVHDLSKGRVRFNDIDQSIQFLNLRKISTGIISLNLYSIAGRALESEFIDSDLPSLETFSDTCATNLISHYAFIKSFEPLLKENFPEKRIILMSTINAIIDGGLPGYSSAKAGLSGLCKSLSGTLQRLYGCDINVIMPGTVAPSDESRAEAKDLKKLDGSTFRGKILREAEVANALSWIGNAPRGFTGQEIVFDLGQTLNLVRYITK